MPSTSQLARDSLLRIASHIAYPPSMEPASTTAMESSLQTEGTCVPEPLTVEGIYARRATAGRLVAGVAAFTHSDQFKGPVSASTQLLSTPNFFRVLASQKPKHGIVSFALYHLLQKSLKFADLLTLESKSRAPSLLKLAANYQKTPGLISLGGGQPHPENFPIEKVSLKIPSIQYREQEMNGDGTAATAGKFDAAEGKSIYDLSISLNYGQATGSAQLLRFVTEHTELVCKPAYEDWGCCLTAGSTCALEMAFRMFCERGDYILSEEYTYALAVETAMPLGLRFVGAKMDAEGLLPDSMDEILSNWDVKARGARKPHLLYTVPSGQNPTGATQSTARRKSIYRVAQKHDVYIIEDEPYYFLQMEPYIGPDSDAISLPSTNSEFLSALVTPYLSFDVDGRVMRMDSFSKVVAPGSRMGWITASAQIVERFVRHNENSVQNPSGFSQIILFKILDETWGHGGYLRWLMHLRAEYTRRRNVLLGACEKYLPKEVVSWDPPMAGMFVRLLFPT